MSRLDTTIQPVSQPQGPPRPRVLGSKPVQVAAVIYAAWLFLLTVTFHLTPDNKFLLEICLLAGAFPAILHSIALPVDTRGSAPGMWFLWAFMVIFLVSYFVNEYTWSDLVNIFNVMIIFLIGIIIASARDTSLVARIAGAYALMITPYLLYVNLTGTRVWGRLIAGSHPNLWGLIAVSVAIGAFTLKSRILQAACLVVVLMTIYNAQSRGSMVAMVPVLFVFVYQWYVHERHIDVSWKLVATCLLAVTLFCFIAFYSDVLINDVLRLNDPRRGLQSGGTGRDQAWVEAIGLWFNAPLFGVGYRKHEELMVLTNISAHNAYLVMLADTGFVGFLVYMAFLVASLMSAVRGVPDAKLRLFLVGFILSYILYGFLEPRAINVGNSYSIIFIFVCLAALRSCQERFRSNREADVAPAMATTLRR